MAPALPFGSPPAEPESLVVVRNRWKVLDDKSKLKSDSKSRSVQRKLKKDKPQVAANPQATLANPNRQP